MAKFNRARVKAQVRSAVVSEAVPSGRTYEGGAGYRRDTKSELFLLAVTNMVGEHTFYESAGQRDFRYAELVGQATLADPEWTARLLKWLRSSANMRTASLVGAAEFARARLSAGLDGMSRQVVDSVLQRPDEPGEMLAYWTAVHGRAIPKPVKRGVADAVRRLYDERALVKYDSDAKGFRFGDVIDLVHPSNSGLVQADLYKHALDRRHGRDEPIPERLTLLRKRQELMALPEQERRAVLRTPERLREAGMTWEALAGWLQGPMDAMAWQAIMPSMGFMAQLRNLRNFDQARVSDKAAKAVADRLADPEQVARSRQLPLRFLSAYRAAPSVRWSWPLEQALTHSLANVPVLGGRTLILVDTSGSMSGPLSARSELMRWDGAAVFGIALGMRCAEADVVSFASTSKPFPMRDGESLLRAVERWRKGGYFLNSGTETAIALRKHFGKHDRVVIVTDEQAAYGNVGTVLPQEVPLYTWNLAGYRHGHAPSGSSNRHTFGGLSDSAFGMIPLLEAGRDADWPF
ncbi:TROVE domain-containing protein [Actinocrispum wychmicini]|uniref:TROVE domain-containing protein n=1 Tax=Actinocrispum wychmicini TaxID=1213861 RepID=A0A4R2JFM6_9PSEU|nr:TROVE domain-containing protein [Actinocrispum wychmicini]TCO55089.1 TROVE domain-containing protein [Actinocrispum wychmicini]